MNQTNGKPVRNMLTASLLVLLGAAAWLVLSASQAGAIVNADQNATTTNIGIGVSNTGGNAAIGNASTNTVGGSQSATATGGTGDAVASNTLNSSNNSDGTANIVTGNANSTGNQATNNTQQVLNADDGNGQPVIVDQNSDTTNIGIGVSNTGLNAALGNVSTNDITVDQTADATSTDGDAIASNSGDVSNNSDGSASIITGNANALGSQSTNRTVQVVDASDPDSLVLADQNVTNLNLGLAFANTGLNFGAGNLSTNTVNPTQTATASGDGDAIAPNSLVVDNVTNGSVVIATGNAGATGNTAVNDNTQTLDADGVSYVKDPSNSTLPLMLLVLIGLLFVGTPVRRLGYRRRV